MHIPGHATCPLCKRQYWKDEVWKRICYPCWKNAKMATETFVVSADELAKLHEEIVYLKHVIDSLSAENNMLKDNRVMILSGMMERIKDLIFLVHPDKHADNPKATEITAWLLEVRKGVSQW